MALRSEASRCQECYSFAAAQALATSGAHRPIGQQSRRRPAANYGHAYAPALLPASVVDSAACAVTVVAWSSGSGRSAIMYQNARSVSLYGGLASPLLRTRGLGELLLLRLLAHSGSCGCKAATASAAGGCGGGKAGATDAVTAAATRSGNGGALPSSTHERSTGRHRVLGGHGAGGGLAAQAAAGAGGGAGAGGVAGADDAAAAAALLQLVLAVSAGQEFECLVQVEPEALCAQLGAAAAGLNGAASPAPAPAALLETGPNTQGAAGALASGGGPAATALVVGFGAGAMSPAAQHVRAHGGSRCGTPALDGTTPGSLPLGAAGAAAEAHGNDATGAAERNPELDTVDAALLEALLGNGAAESAPAGADTSVLGAGALAHGAAGTSSVAQQQQQQQHPHWQYASQGQGQGTAAPSSAPPRRSFTNLHRPRLGPLSAGMSEAFASAAPALPSATSADLEAASPFIVAQTPRPHAPTACDVISAACANAAAAAVPPSHNTLTCSRCDSDALAAGCNLLCGASDARNGDGDGGGAGGHHDHHRISGAFAAQQNDTAAAPVAGGAAEEAAAAEQWNGRGGCGGWRSSPHVSLPVTPRPHQALFGEDASFHTPKASTDAAAAATRMPAGLAAAASAGLLPWRANFIPLPGAGSGANPIAASVAVTTPTHSTAAPSPTLGQSPLGTTQGLCAAPCAIGAVGSNVAELSAGAFAQSQVPLVSPAASRQLPQLGMASTMPGSGGAGAHNAGAAHHSGLLACLTPLHKGSPMTHVMSQLVQAGVAAAAQRRQSIGGGALRRSLSASGLLDVEHSVAAAAATAATVAAAGALASARASGPGLCSGSQPEPAPAATGIAGSRRPFYTPPRHQSALGYSALQGPTAAMSVAACSDLYGMGTGTGTGTVAGTGTGTGSGTVVATARSTAGCQDPWLPAGGALMLPSPMPSQPAALLHSVGSFGRSRLGPGSSGGCRNFLGSHPGTFAPAGRLPSSGGATSTFAAAVAAAAAASYSVDQAASLGRSLAPLFTIADEAAVEYGSDDVRLDGSSARVANIDGGHYAANGNGGDSHVPSAAVSATTRCSVGSFALPASVHRGVGCGASGTGSGSPPAAGRRRGAGASGTALLDSTAEVMEGLVLVGGAEGEEDEDADAGGTRTRRTASRDGQQQPARGDVTAAAGSGRTDGATTAALVAGTAAPVAVVAAGRQEAAIPRAANAKDTGASAAAPITLIPHSGHRNRAGTHLPNAATSGFPSRDAIDENAALTAPGAAEASEAAETFLSWTSPPQPIPAAAWLAMRGPCASALPNKSPSAAAAAAALGRGGEASLGVSPAAPPALALDTLVSDDSLGALGRFASGVLVSPTALQRTPTSLQQSGSLHALPGQHPSTCSPAPAAGAAPGASRSCIPSSAPQQALHQQVPSLSMPRSSAAAAIMRGRPSLQLYSSSPCNQQGPFGGGASATAQVSQLPLQLQGQGQGQDQQQQQQQQPTQAQSTPLYKLGSSAGGVGRARGVGLKRNTTRDRVQMLFSSIRHQEQQQQQQHSVQGQGPAQMRSPRGSVTATGADPSLGAMDGRGSGAQQPPWSPGRGGAHGATGTGFADGRATSFRHSCGGMLLQARHHSGSGMPSCRSMSRSCAATGLEAAAAAATAVPTAAAATATAAAAAASGVVSAAPAACDPHTVGVGSGTLDVSGVLAAAAVPSATSNRSRRWHTAGTGTAASLASPMGPVANVTDVASAALQGPVQGPAAAPAVGTARPSLSKQAAGPPVAAPGVPRRPRWHRLHAVLCDTAQQDRLHVSGQQAPHAHGCGAGGAAGAAAAAAAAPAALVPEQQSDKAAASETVMFITITQIDVTEQVEAQAQLAKLLEQEHKVLEGIYPRHVIEYYSAGGGKLIGSGAGGGPGAGAAGPHGAPANVERMASLATWHEGVTILFADIVGFTAMCHHPTTTPLTVMVFLNQLYSRFDAMIDIYKIYKVETIGDCYMVAGGLVHYDDDGYKSVISGGEDPLHAVRVMEFAKAMLRAARDVRMPHTGEPVQMRIGLHSGPVTSGVVGDRMPRFCLFGDTVNTASRMESTCRPGTIHVSAATQARVPNEPWRDCGMTEVKGKGQLQTYEWAGDVDSPYDGNQLQRVIGLYL
ncbi:hypothetical protein HYH02_013667 [Chlamydomonas schloesseri]|uniref:Guanylate cyclase domain-containing protein n=1 Tax=Chlamydomonas schloesseri TaxID=2026947 RepID=A0A835SYP8_9CHLO|nr:hypothetical protein HYH02_013667 [Chlamydomonas schloesseri]|eukprot:KAG2430669.1 hypothetical protein HYH02_013667 [Chlamydomonas schloesseri]